MYASRFAPLRRAMLPCLGLLAALCLLLTAPDPAQASGPSTITYTGQLLSGSTPVANGLYDFQFSLYTVSSGGSQTGSTVSVTSVPVEDGVFYVELNFGTAINSSVLYLQTAYRLHGGSSYTTQPTRKLLATTAFTDYSASSGYALISGNTWRLEGYKISTTAPTAGQVLEWNGGTSLWTPTTFANPPGSVTGPMLALPLSLSSAGSSPVVTVSNTSSGGDGIDASTSGGYGVYASAGAGYGLYGFSNSGVGVGAETNGGTAVSAVNYGNGPGGVFSAEGSGIGAAGYSISWYGVYGRNGAGSGLSPLYGYGGGAWGDSDNGLGLLGTSGTGYGVVGMTKGGGVGLYGASGTGDGVYASSNAGTGVNASGGAIGVYGACAGGPGVYAYGGGVGVARPAMYAYNANGQGISIYSLNNSTDANLVISNGGSGDLIKAFNGGNNLYFEVKANGTTIVRQLQITGGADVAEPYTVGAAGGVTPRPGMVVSIDPAHVGQMVLASAAYDRTVAGILSGAGGIQPGLTLHQKDTAADGGGGGLPVACTGRVWCFCDADAGGAIAPGDLLTTSATPGHAMKAADESRSRGAILGKAMSSLPSGKGLVLVLVTLQ